MRSRFDPLRGWRRDLGSVLLSSDCPEVSPRPTSDGGFPTLLSGPSGKRHWILRGREKSADAPRITQEKSACSLFARLPCRRLLEFLYNEVVDPLFLLLRSCQTVALEYRLLFVPTLPSSASFRRQSRSPKNGERASVSSPAAGAAVGSTGLLRDSGAQQRAVDSRDPAREGVPGTGDVQSPSQGQAWTPEPKEPSASRGDTTSTYSLSERDGDARQSYVLRVPLFAGTCAVASALGVAVVTFVALRHLLSTSDWVSPPCALLETFFGESDRLARNKIRVELRTASIWHPLFTVVSVCAVLGSVAAALFLAASAATVVVSFVFGAWARQAVVRKWKKVASLLVVEQKYIKEILRWTQEVAVTHRALDSWVLLNAPAPGTKVSTARDPSREEAISGSRRFAGRRGPSNESASPLQSSPSSASGASPSSLSSSMTAELRRMFVETGVRTGRGLRRATDALLSGVSCGDMFREIWREVAGDVRGESRLGTPSAYILSSNASHEEDSRKASLAGVHKQPDYSFSLSNMKHVASQLWRSERDLCAGFQTCLLQLISDTVSRASCPPSSLGNSDAVASSSEMGAKPVRYRDAACEAVRAAPEPVGGSRPSEIKYGRRMHQCPGDESTSPILSMRRQHSSRRIAESGCGGRAGGSAVCGKPRRNARRKEVKFDVGASATKDGKERRAAAGLRSLFDELMEVREMDGGGTASVGGPREQDSDPEKKTSSMERSCEREETEKEVGRDRKQDATGNDNAFETFSGEEATDADVPISPSGISREGGAAFPLSTSGLSSGSPFLFSSSSFCVSHVATITTNCGSSSARLCPKSSSFASPSSSSTPAPVSGLAHVFRTAVAEAARTLQALEALASLTDASWKSMLQLVGILFALKIAESELEKSTGQLRSALFYDWARLAATGVRAPFFVLPSRLAPASSDSSTSRGCSPNGRGPSGCPRRDAEPAKVISNPAKDEGSCVVPCCLCPPRVSPLFRDSSALLSPGDLRVGLGRLNQHVAAALALLRLGPSAPSCSMPSYRSSSAPRTAGGRDDLGERDALSFAAAQLCTRCRGTGSHQDAALLAHDNRGPEGTSTASASELARSRCAGRQTAEGDPDEAGDEETDAEWIHVLQATQQQLAFAQQSCDKALQLFFKRQRDRDRRKGGKNDVPQDGCEEAATATSVPQGEGEARRQEGEGKQEGERQGPLALPAPPQDLLEIYKGLGEDDGGRQRPSPESVPLFNDEVDGATLARGRLAVGELKRVFLSHPRIQRQRQQRRLVKEFVSSSASAASARGERGEPSARAPDPSRGAWEVRDDSEDEEARRVRLELREEEGEEDDREDAFDFPDLTEWHVDRAMPPASGTGRDPGDEDGRATEIRNQEDNPDDQTHSLITQKRAVTCGPAGTLASVTSQEEASEPREIQTKPTEAHTDPEADGSLLSGLGLGETTPESLQFARRLRREAEAARGVRSLFVELSGQLARCGVSTKGSEQVDLRVRSFEFPMGQKGAFVGRQGRQAEGFLEIVEGGDLDPAEPRPQRCEGNQCQAKVCSNQSQDAFTVSASSVSPSTAPFFPEPEEGRAALPPVFGLLVRQRGGRTEEAFCGVGEAEAEGDDEWDCASWGEARETEGVEVVCWPRSGGEEEGGEDEVDEQRRLCQRKGNRNASEAKARKVRRDADCGSVGEWEEGSWCLEGRSDGEEEPQARTIEQKTGDETP